MSNVVINANGSGAIGGNMLLEEDDGQVPLYPQDNNSIRMPASEEEADMMIAGSLGNDPAKMRLAAVEFAKKMERLASAIDGGAAAPATSAAPAVASTPAAVVAETAAVPAEQTPATPAPTASRGVDLPTGYMAVPEGLYHWSPEAWGGRPLHAVPDRAIERQGQPTLLIFVLLAPAFARNRSGRIVSLPEGARVVVHASIAWAPVVPLAKGPEGRPVLFAVPTALDSIDGKVRQAAPGEELFRYATGDGGHEYGMMILYDPDPRDPTRPRLISLETLRGAMHEAQGGK